MRRHRQGAGLGNRGGKVCRLCSIPKSTLSVRFECPMLAIVLMSALSASQNPVQLSARPSAGGRNDYYIGNRKPLAPAPFRKLPIGAIRPEGWLRKQLELEANGFTGHLEEISGFLNRKDNAWLSPTGDGQHGWEETPYWLKGFGDLGYVLGDKRIIADAKFWIEHMLAGQASDGWFGPRSNLVSNDGKPDMWPNMLLLNVLQSYYEYTGEKRILRAMERYFKWQWAQPENQFYLSYWERQRGGDNLASVYWLYNRTGAPKLLELAQKIHRRTADWVSGVHDWHGVNFAQAFREPAEYGVLSGDAKDYHATEADYWTMRDAYGQVPGGMYGADENARPGFSDPRQATETCAMVEMMNSTEMLLFQSGDPNWAERCEDVTFNSLPASMTPDLRALHYLTAPNMVLADKGSKAPGLQNGGPMLLFNPYDHRCCQHNVSMGWPYFAEHLWAATDDNGLAAVLYAPCTVSATIGDGKRVTIREETHYPFEEQIRFKMTLTGAAKFPFTLRLPSWCDTPALRINGKTQRVTPLTSGSGFYATINREWRDGDMVALTLPMKVRIKRWQANPAVSVERGPLTYSLKIGEQYVRAGGTDSWPAFELHPSTAWNYGLTLGAMHVAQKAWPRDNQPFDVNSAPIEIRTEARRIPEWTLDRFGLCPTLQPSPAKSVQPMETVTLIPMGAARLRISAFPTVSPEGHPWMPPKRVKAKWIASASHLNEGDALDALSDGLNPKNSDDQSIPRFTWWDHKGGTEWVEYDLHKPQTFSFAEVYWFDDTRSGGGCRVPASWRLLYRVGNEWKEIQPSNPYGVSPDRFNVVQFAPVRSSVFRLEAKLQYVFSSGILEWVLR